MNQAQKYLTCIAAIMIWGTMFYAPWVATIVVSNGGLVQPESRTTVIYDNIFQYPETTSKQAWTLQVAQLCMEWIGIGIVYTGLFFFLCKEKQVLVEANQQKKTPEGVEGEDDVKVIVNRGPLGQGH